MKIKIVMPMEKKIKTKGKKNTNDLKSPGSFLISGSKQRLWLSLSFIVDKPK